MNLMILISNNIDLCMNERVPFMMTFLI